MRVHALFIFEGYVESNSMSGLPIFHEDGFDSVEEALANFADAVLSSHAADKEYYRRVCCKKAIEEHPGYKRCPECGEYLSSEIDENEGISALHAIGRGTANDTAHAYDFIVEAGWKYGAWALPEILAADGVVTVHSVGSELLWHAYKGQLVRVPGPDDDYYRQISEHVELSIRKGVPDRGVKLFKDVP